MVGLSCYMESGDIWFGSREYGKGEESFFLSSAFFCTTKFVENDQGYILILLSHNTWLPQKYSTCIYEQMFSWITKGTFENL